MQRNRELQAISSSSKELKSVRHNHKFAHRRKKHDSKQIQKVHGSKPHTSHQCRVVAAGL